MIKQSRLKIDWAIVMIAVFAVYYTVHALSIMLEVSYLTWLDQLDTPDKLYSGTLQIPDLMRAYGEHGMFGYCLIYIINIILFQGTALFDVWVNVGLVLISSIAIYISYKKSMGENYELAFSLLFGLLAFILFAVSQTSREAMEKQVRRGVAFMVLTCVSINVFGRHILLRTSRALL